MSEKSTQSGLSDVRVGVIGLGMGSGHARRLLQGEIQGASLGAVCDLDPERCVAFADVPSYQDVAVFLSEAAIDAVIVATPHFSHVPLALQAFAASKHVLVEKPLAVQKSDCERIIQEADAHPELVFAEMFNQRTNPLYIKLKQLIDDGELGELRRINWIITDWFRTESYYASGGWRATWHGEGGGVLVNQCPHNLDLLQWLCGMPSKLRSFCHLGKYHDIEVEDEVTSYLEYPNGATGIFVTSTGEAPGTNRLEIIGERGKVVVENNAIQWTRNEVPMSDFSRDTEQRFGGPATWDISIPVAANDSEHKAVLQQFVSRIQGVGTLVADGREGIHSVELANAMLLSSELDKTIDLPMSSAEFSALLEKLIAQSPKTPSKEV